MAGQVLSLCIGWRLTFMLLLEDRLGYVELRLLQADLGQLSRLILSQLRVFDQIQLFLFLLIKVDLLHWSNVLFLGHIDSSEQLLRWCIGCSRSLRNDACPGTLLKLVDKLRSRLAIPGAQRRMVELTDVQVTELFELFELVLVDANLFFERRLKVFFHHLSKDLHVPLLFRLLLLLFSQPFILNLLANLLCLDLLNLLPIFGQLLLSLLLQHFMPLLLTLFEVISKLHSSIKRLLHHHLLLLHRDLLLLHCLQPRLALNRLLDKFGVIVPVFFIQLVFCNGQLMQLALVSRLFNYLLRSLSMLLEHKQLLLKLPKCSTLDLVFLKHICITIRDCRILGKPV